MDENDPSDKDSIDSTAPKVLTVLELAEYLRVHPTTIYRLLKAGKIPGFRLGAEWRFSIEVIDRWRLRQEQSARPTRRSRD